MVVDGGRVTGEVGTNASGIRDEESNFFTFLYVNRRRDLCQRL